MPFEFGAKDEFWVVLPAAGKGTRMLSDMPKQYLSVLGKSCLQHTLDKFDQLRFVSGVCVVLSEHDTDFHNFVVANQSVSTTIGGSERSDSVLQGLNAILSLGAKPTDWVLVHDAARPCVSPQNISNLAALCAQKDCSAILASPIADTVKKQNAINQIEQTIERDGLWLAHTPQCARIGKLKQALEYALQNNINITDEASALELIGEAVQLVPDSRDNIKITRPEDLWLAEKILEHQLG